MKILKGSAFDKKIHVVNTRELSLLLSNAEKGGYYGICNPHNDFNTFYISMVKNKSEILFQYQGINREMNDSRNIQIESAVQIYNYLLKTSN